MDATALASLSRQKIVALAKAHKIKGNLSNKEIIRQLVELFPDGVPPAPAKGFVNAVKGAFKAIGSRVGSLAPESSRNLNANQPTPVTPVPTTEANASSSRTHRSTGRSPESRPSLSYSDTANLIWTPPPPKAKATIDTPDKSPSLAPTEIVDPAPPSPYTHSNAAMTNLVRPPSPPKDDDPLHSLSVRADYDEEEEYNEEDYDEEYDDYDDESSEEEAPEATHAADPEDVKRLIQDMAAISARNKVYTEKATLMFQRAEALQEQTAHLRTALVVEQTRRQRMEDYYRNWRPMDPDWSYAAMWGGELTFAPVLARFDDPQLKGSLLMEQEVSSGDDEALVAHWYRQDAEFKARRRQREGAKAKARGTDVEWVSSDETQSDEEMFYAPFVLRPENDDGTIPDEQCLVHPLNRQSEGILLNRAPDIVVRHPVKRAREEDDDGADADDEATRHSPRPRFERTTVALPVPDMSHPEFELVRDRGLAMAMGKTAFPPNWRGLGHFRGGWWVSRPIPPLAPGNSGMRR